LRTGKDPASSLGHDPDGTRQKILSTLEKPPPSGRDAWDGASVAAKLGISTHKVWRVLKNAGVRLGKQRSWRVELASSAATLATEIAGLYIGPPDCALVVSLAGRLKSAESVGAPHSCSRQAGRWLARSTPPAHGRRAWALSRP
jgi:hypothetical protein